jgi:NAD(P)-dependent dehydrogenase (short-subunit alcohol dehydrogenase family)
MAWSPDGEALRGRVAVVAGATRGAGRGIAAALGEAGATVICTGRSSVTGRGGSDYDRPETIEETAELVARLGGTGIAIQVDHLDSDQVRSLAERVRVDHGGIDVLVNDIWGAEVLKGGPSDWNTPIWEHDLDRGLDTPAGRRHSPDHFAPPAPTSDKQAGRFACRGHGRHR